MTILKRTVIVIFCISLLIFIVAVVKELISSDSSIPEITSDRDVLEVPCNYTESQLLEGLSAYDQDDGDLTSKIVVGSMSRFINPGVCNVTYVVFDSSNHSASFTRKVRFSDYHAPRFNTSEPLVFTEREGNSTLLKERIIANDIIDGEISESVINTSSDINYSVAGTYHSTYEVSNRFGDTSTIELPVHIIKSENNQIDIKLTQGIIYINTGDTIDAADYIESVTSAQGRTLHRVVKIESNVDNTTPGVYEIHYSASYSGTNGETWLTVVVQ